MHKLTSDLAQRRARQLWFKDLPINVDWDNLPDAEKRANLVTAKKSLQTRLDSLPKASTQRKALCDQIQEMNAAIHALRPKLKGNTDVPGFFVDVCRERMNKVQFSAIMSEASERAKAREAELIGGAAP